GGPDGLFMGGGFESLKAQAIGTLAVGAFTFTLAFVAWNIIKMLMGMRVDVDDEIRGLDLSEMGMEAYPGDITAD
ncbi:MAG TPA: hypothetical protein VF982_11115, partial [Anaerolineales bacterium]